MNKKFELLLDDTIEVFGRKLFRIKAKINFSSVAAGELGGYIEKEENLSHFGNAWVSELGDVVVFKNYWSSGRHFTYTKSNKLWRVGCFYGTGEELIAKAYKDSEVSGKHYESYVNLVLELEKIDG